LLVLDAKHLRVKHVVKVKTLHQFIAHLTIPWGAIRMQSLTEIWQDREGWLFCFVLEMNGILSCVLVLAGEREGSFLTIRDGEFHSLLQKEA